MSPAYYIKSFFKAKKLKTWVPDPNCIADEGGKGEKIHQIGSLEIFELDDKAHSTVYTSDTVE